MSGQAESGDGAEEGDEGAEEGDEGAQENAGRALLGTLLDGRYRVERILGAGGFGTVYAALHVGLGAPVALKVLRLPEHVRTSQIASAVGRFLDEARTLKRLRHPNIVGALDVGLLPADARGVSVPYLVMEWCGGPSLRRMLGDRGEVPLPLGEAWRLFEPLLDAIAHAHALGVAHRDIKPDNVLLEPLGDGSFKPRVIDFGIAKIVAPDETAGSGVTHTTSGRSPFTPRYAAPEQLAGARTGPWTDVHALALLFVELVTGRPAFGDHGDAMFAAFNPLRPTPGTRGVDVGALEPVLERALAVRPDERYADAAELAIAMRAAAGEASTASIAPAAYTSPPRPAPLARVDLTAPPSSHTLRTIAGTTVPRPLPRRTKWIAAASAIALIVIGGAAGVARYAGWSPSAARLRNVTAPEIERRTRAFGLGACTTTAVPGMHAIACEKANVQLHRGTFGGYAHDPSAKVDVTRTYVNGMAMAMRGEYGAARYAIDDDVAIIVSAPPDKVGAIFDAVLDGLIADVRADAAEPEIPKMSAAASSALAAWSANDLWAGTAHTGEKTFAVPGVNPPSVSMSRDDGKSAVATLYSNNARATLEAMKKNRRYPFGYAIDGDRLLFVIGDPVFANAAFVRRVLGGVHASEIGENAP